MNQIATIEEGKAVSNQQKFRDELTRMGDQFVAALPEHIKPERFQRIVLTAVLGDAALLRADRKTLLESAMRAAQDGLLPDKREGAFVVFNTKVKIDGKDQWINAVQWMPMIGGIIKKMHQSGEIMMITAKVVYGGDVFRAWVDDDGEHVAYEQAEHPDYDIIRQVFAMAKTKTGAVYVETLTTRDIEKIRSVSRSKDSGPWAKWWEEMAKKSAIRRLAKRLPLSAEIHDLIQRDNELYDLSQAPEPRPSLQQRLAIGRQATGEASQSREGFDADFATHETAALSGEAAIEQEPIDQEPSDEVPPSDAGSGAAAPSTGSAADQTAQTGEAEEGATEAAHGEQVAPSSDLNEAEWLMGFARAMVAAIGVDEQFVVATSKGGFVEGLSDDTRDRARAITNYARSVCRGEVDKADALEVIAGKARCEVAALEQKGGA